MEERVLWIARDKDNKLYLYEDKPFVVNGKKFECYYYLDCWRIPEELYPEITFENSPKQLIIKQD